MEEERNGEESDEDNRHSPEVDDGTPIVTPNNLGEHLTAETTQSNIPVQRLVQSVKQVFIMPFTLSLIACSALLSSSTIFES